MKAPLIAFESTQNVVVAALQSTSLDASNAARFKEEVVGRITAGKPWLIDLAQVAFVDSSGLGALVSCLRQAQEQGCRLGLCSLQKRVVVLFELVRLYRIFDIYETRDVALRTLEST